MPQTDAQEPDATIDQHAIGEWLEWLSEKSPTPGGGSVAALVGAIGAALGSMVVAYTRGKKAFADAEPELGETSKRLDRLRFVLLALADEDARAYSTLNELMRLAEDDPRRVEHWTQAVRDAIDVPRAGVASGASLASLLESLAGSSNPWLGSDLAIAADLAAVAAAAFAWNVRVNLPQLEAGEQSAAIEAETDRLVARARESADRVTRIVREQSSD